MTITLCVVWSCHGLYRDRAALSSGTIRCHEERDETAFAAFVLSAAAAANGRDRIASAPSLPPAAAPSRPAGAEGLMAGSGVVQVALALAGLAGQLAGQLTTAAASPAGPEDRVACTHAAWHAARIASLLGGAPETMTTWATFGDFATAAASQLAYAGGPPGPAGAPARTGPGNVSEFARSLRRLVAVMTRYSADIEAAITRLPPDSRDQMGQWLWASSRTSESLRNAAAFLGPSPPDTTPPGQDEATAPAARAVDAAVTALTTGRDLLHTHLASQPGGDVVARSEWAAVLQREGGQAGLPRPGAVPVGPAGVGGDQQPGRGRVGRLAHRVPPAADRLHGERRGVMVGAHADPPGVGGQVVHPVRDRRALPPAGEVMIADPHRVAPGPPFPAGAGVIADLLLLLGVHADHRVPGGLVRADLAGDVPELPSRSACRAPSITLALACKLNPCPRSRPATVSAETS